MADTKFTQLTDAGTIAGTDILCIVKNPAGAATSHKITASSLITYNDVAWTDYSATSTITGWSSFTRKEILYKKNGTLVFVSFQISGTSDSASISFTVPYTSNSLPFNSFACIFVTDDGVNQSTPGRLFLPASSSTVTLGKNLSAAGGFTASGSKTVVGQFFYVSA